jgi:hypothetical protein
MLTVAISLSLALLLLALGPASAQDASDGGVPANRGWVVVQGDGTVVRTITFTTPISGLGALQATGLDVTVADTGFGPAVCAIDGVGCPAEDCFCHPDEFWTYAFWDGEAWQPYAVGAASSLIAETDAVEGWRWGEFEAGGLPAAPQVKAAAQAIDWLQGQQSAKDGGFGNMAGTVETMLSIGANGLQADGWQAEGALRDLQDFARIHQTKFSRGDVAAAGKLAVAIAATNSCWNGRAVEPSAFYSDTLGAYSTDSGRNAWAILGTAALSQTVPAEAVDVLKGAILPAGAWEWQPGFGADSNTTALTVQALLAAGEPVSATEVISGLAFLKSLQQDDGGFAYDASGMGSDANSTAYVLQAIAAAGEDASRGEWATNEVNAVEYLLSLQLEDGSFAWQAGGESNLFATQQAVAGLLGRPYPFASKVAERCSWK